jgi:hypothetical protein
MKACLPLPEMPKSCYDCDFVDFTEDEHDELYCTYLPIDDCICPNNGRHPDCPLKPVEDNDYTTLAQLAYDMVLATMQEGERKHGKDGWKDIYAPEHAIHASSHVEGWYVKDKTEDHIAHALTRCAMIRWKEMQDAKG